MTWIDLLESGAIKGLLTVSKPMLASALYAGLQEGLTGASMLRIMQSAGLGMRRQDFYRVLRSAKSFQAARQGASARALSGRVGDHDVGDVAGPAGQKYISVVTVHYQQEIDGELVNLTKDIFVRSTENLTVGQVVTRAYNVWGHLQQSERYPLGGAVGLEYGGTVWQAS